MKRILIIAIVLITPGSLLAQASKAPRLGWDLTYKTVLVANNVAPGEWIWRWLGPNYESRAKAWISSWKHGPIQSSILLEFPAAHAGERLIMWFVRTKDGAYYYERAEGNALLKDGKPRHETHGTLNGQAYDKFFSVASHWQQGNAVKPENTPVGGIPGYDGFYSLYDRGTSRQMLLTIEDWAVCDDKKCEHWKPGRLVQALMLIPRSGRAR
jgi:hypothetical protein